MSKLSSLTENKYTLRDIFVRNHEVWLAIPLFCFLITPIVHIIVYFLCFDLRTENVSQIAHTMATNEWIGDYYKPIVMSFTVFAAFLAVISFISHIDYKKHVGNKCSANLIPSLFFLGVCVLVIVSTVINKTEKPLLLGYSQRGEGIFTVLCYFLVYYLCGSLIRNIRIKYTVISLFLVTSILIGSLVLINYYLTEVRIMVNGYFTGIFYHENFYAYYLTMAIMLSAALFALEKNKAARIFAFFSFCLNSVVLAFNNSFGGFIACLVAFVFLIIAASIKKGKFSFSALATLLVFLAICFAVGLKYESFFSELVTLGNDVEKIASNAEDADSAGTWRWGLWRKTWEYIKERPLIGYGIEGTVERLAADTGQQKVHNEYLDYAVEYGIPAALLYISGLVSIFIKALIRRKSVDNATLVCLTASLGYIASAFFGNRMIFILPFFFIFLGLANNTEPPYKKLPLQKEEWAKATALSDADNEETAEEPAGKSDNEGACETEEKLTEEVERSV